MSGEKAVASCHCDQSVGALDAVGIHFDVLRDNQDEN
jgi:hypothetical protein